MRGIVRDVESAGSHLEACFRGRDFPSYAVRYDALLGTMAVFFVSVNSDVVSDGLTRTILLGPTSLHSLLST